jgi:glycerol uptake facilitator protein
MDIHMLETIKKWIFVKPDLVTKFTSEFIGCMLFHLMGSLSPTPECNAVTLMTIVFFTAKLSGGHLNPIITWIFNLLGYTNPIELCVYIVSQIAGSIIGALWLSTIVPELQIGCNNQGVKYNGCFVPHEALSITQIIACEALGTYSFSIIIFSVVWYTQKKQGYGTIGPIMVGLSLLSPAYAFGRYSGAAFNPARTIASYIVYKCVPGYVVWCYVVGQTLGSFLAALTIVPWYGIAEDSWYMPLIKREIMYIMSIYQQQSIQLHASNSKKYIPNSPITV